MELCRASLVCRSWLEAANDERRTRGPTYFIQNCKELLANEKLSMERIKMQSIKKLQIKPALGLFFTAPSIPFSEPDCHCKVLPPNCDTVTLGTHGVVFNNREIEGNVENIVCAFLPEVPDVTIKTFVIGDNSATKNDVSMSVENYSEEIKKVLRTSEKSPNRSKCLLLFCDLRGRNLAVKLSNSLRKSYTTDELSVWGGIAKDLLVCNAKDSKNDRCGEFAFCVGITLTGALDTWSIIVGRSYMTKDRVEQRMKSFRNRVRLKKHSIGFMFACFARGEYMFDECNVESTIFKKYFPEIPLVGCFGDGEFGKNSLPNESNKKAKWYNVTSTIFLIITYG
ncbi:F-box only protein 22 [Dufourea novaeangliae]|uniref:F-box only protein 22 n=2 Tax=Dufourea novaeangliae TaxID=178035 RepID=A0A154PD74_DUFNO|nr:F-box only protein 22 [Dufourea novaeangliae]